MPNDLLNTWSKVYKLFVCVKKTQKLKTKPKQPKISTAKHRDENKHQRDHRVDRILPNK